MMSTPKTIGLLGTSGAGKTTLARELARRMDAIFIEHDAIRHQANWTTASEEEVRTAIEQRIAGQERWVIDRVPGDYLSERIDVILWLDLPLHLKLARASKRSWHRLRSQEELWNGNRESWRGVLFEWDGVIPHLLRSHYRQRRKVPQRSDYAKVIRLKTVQEVEIWLKETFPEPQSLRNGPFD
jgi:adenylate kinase family enzyme